MSVSFTCRSTGERGIIHTPWGMGRFRRAPSSGIIGAAPGGGRPAG